MLDSTLLDYANIFDVLFHVDITLESGIDVGWGINVGPEKLVKRIYVGPWRNVGHEQNVQSYVTKNLSNLEIYEGHEKNSKI